LASDILLLEQSTVEAEMHCCRLYL